MNSKGAEYVKPEIREYGTLKELTAICAAPGSGDSFNGIVHLGLTSSIGVIGSNSFCVSS